MEKTPQELTHEGLRNSLENGKVNNVVIQILSIEKNTKPGIIEVIVSDGFAKHKAIFCEEASKKIEGEQGKKYLYSVIEVKTGFAKKTNVEIEMFVRKFDVVAENLLNQIGEPIEYALYKQANFQNDKGSSQIPTVMSQPKKKSQPILVSNKEPSENFMTLNMLSMMTEDWRVKARIIKKSEKKNWKNARSEGTLFHIDIVDCTGTEMNCSFFNNSCEKWYDVLEAGKTYVFSGGTVKMNNSKFNQKSDYQIVFDEKTDIQIVDEDPNIIKQKFHFVKINKITELPVSTSIDVIGIVKECGSYSEVNVKNSNAPKGRKIIQIYDDSMSGIEVTLWGDLANKDYPKNSIIILKNTRTNDFKEIRNLTSSFQTSIISDPTNEEYKKLEQWKSSISSEELEKISIKDREKKLYRFKTLAQVDSEVNKLGGDPNEKVFTDVKCYVLLLKNDERSPLYYVACPNEKCSKKVVEDMTEGWRCESCDKSFKEPAIKYLLQARICDESLSIWATLFDSVGNVVLGKTASEIKQMKEQGQNDLINNIIKGVAFKQYKMRVMSRIDSYNGESRIKHQVLRVFAKDNLNDCKVVAEEIDEYLAMGNDKNIF